MRHKRWTNIVCVWEIDESDQYLQVDADILTSNSERRQINKCWYLSGTVNSCPVFFFFFFFLGGGGGGGVGVARVVSVLFCLFIRLMGANSCD